MPQKNNLISEFFKIFANNNYNIYNNNNIDGIIN